MRLLFVLFLVLLCVPFVLADVNELICVESPTNTVTLPVTVAKDNALHLQLSTKTNEKYTCGEGSSFYYLGPEFTDSVIDIEFTLKTADVSSSGFVDFSVTSDEDDPETIFVKEKTVFSYSKNGLMIEFPVNYETDFKDYTLSSDTKYSFLVSEFDSSAKTLSLLLFDDSVTITKTKDSSSEYTIGSINNYYTFELLEGDTLSWKDDILTVDFVPLTEDTLQSWRTISLKDANKNYNTDTPEYGIQVSEVGKRLQLQLHSKEISGTADDLTDAQLHAFIFTSESDGLSFLMDFPYDTDDAKTTNVNEKYFDIEGFRLSKGDVLTLDGFSHDSTITSPAYSHSFRGTLEIMEDGEERDNVLLCGEDLLDKTSSITEDLLGKGTTIEFELYSNNNADQNNNNALEKNDYSYCKIRDCLFQGNSEKSGETRLKCGDNPILDISYQNYAFPFKGLHWKEAEEYSTLSCENTASCGFPYSTFINQIETKIVLGEGASETIHTIQGFESLKYIGYVPTAGNGNKYVYKLEAESFKTGDVQFYNFDGKPVYLHEGSLQVYGEQFAVKFPESYRFLQGKERMLFSADVSPKRKVASDADYLYHLSFSDTTGDLESVDCCNQESFVSDSTTTKISDLGGVSVYGCKLQERRQYLNTDTKFVEYIPQEGDAVSGCKQVEKKADGAVAAIASGASAAEGTLADAAVAINTNGETCAAVNKDWKCQCPIDDYFTGGMAKEACIENNCIVGKCMSANDRPFYCCSDTAKASYRSANLKSEYASKYGTAATALDYGVASASASSTRGGSTSKDGGSARSDEQEKTGDCKKDCGAYACYNQNQKCYISCVSLKNSYCADGYVCDNDNKCKEPCNTNDDCTSSQTCNTQTGICEGSGEYGAIDPTLPEPSGTFYWVSEDATYGKTDNLFGQKWKEGYVCGVEDFSFNIYVDDLYLKQKLFTQIKTVFNSKSSSNTLDNEGNLIVQGTSSDPGLPDPDKSTYGLEEGSSCSFKIYDITSVGSGIVQWSYIYRPYFKIFCKEQYAAGFKDKCTDLVENSWGIDLAPHEFKNTNINEINTFYGFDPNVYYTGSSKETSSTNDLLTHEKAMPGPEKETQSLLDWILYRPKE